MSKLKRYSHNSLVVGAITGAAVVAGLFGAHAIQNAHAATYATNCDDNAVVYCGAQDASDLTSKVDGSYSNPYKETSTSILNIYSYFGISKADVDAMPGEEVEGTVTKTGDVIVNGKTVATGVTTAGRMDISGSAKHEVNGTTFYTRAPSVSFLDASLPAMVVMKNGVFQFAIMNSCGNPVTGHATTTPPPAPKPATLTCSELSLTPGTVESNSDQGYTLEAQATTANGATISSYVFDFGDSTSKTVSSASTSASTTHTYSPGTWTAKVTVNGSASGKSLTAPATTSCEKTITVKSPTPTPTPTPTPGSLVCDDLTLTPGSTDDNGNVSYTLAAKATPSASNASITGYTFNFGDGSQNATVSSASTSASTTHTYAPGNWTATVTVNGTVSGGSVSETSANCSGPVNVGQAPVSPVYVCSGLTMSPAGQADAQGNVSYDLSATASATNATITSYTFDFGDNSQADTVTSSDTIASDTHTYAPGTYTASVTVTVTLSDGTTKTVTAGSCQAKITVAAPTCTSATGQTYPAGSSQCQTCTAPSGQTYPAGSSECTPTTPTPTTSTPTTTALPDTGPGDVAGLFSGVSMSGAGIHRILGNRRARRGAVRR
jgi:hypothetical protein